MIVNSVNKNSNTSFQASIVHNRQLILKSLLKDKKLTSKDYSAISELLDGVDSFAKMPEDSVVEIFSRNDSGQVRLICNVYDKEKRFLGMVDQRAVRKLAQDKNFREKYLQNVKSLIQKIFITAKEINKISEAIIRSKKIKSIADNLEKKDLTLDNVKSLLENSKFKSYFVKALDRGYNPSEKIIRLINFIDKKAKGSEICLKIDSKRNPKTHYTTSYFVVSDKTDEKRVPLLELFKQPLENKLL
ncbi:MAG: hypothetical protein WCY19_06955 [Candidatus Gastranaerophilaceae bacterium]